jgi:hypothetical protein
MRPGSYVIISSGAAHQARLRKEREEEEQMTPYSNEDLQQDWEFKIVRSITGAFSKREKIKQVMAEEAAAQWRLVEKFDNNRLRFKRPASAQQNDDNLPEHIDPYRTTYGMSEWTLAGIFLGIFFGFFVVLPAFVFIALWIIAWLR